MQGEYFSYIIITGHSCQSNTAYDTDFLSITTIHQLFGSKFKAFFDISSIQIDVTSRNARYKRNSGVIYTSSYIMIL